MDKEQLNKKINNLFGFWHCDNLSIYSTIDDLCDFISEVLDKDISQEKIINEFKDKVEGMVIYFYIMKEKIYLFKF